MIDEKTHRNDAIKLEAERFDPKHCGKYVAIDLVGQDDSVYEITNAIKLGYMNYSLGGHKKVNCFVEYGNNRRAKNEIIESLKYYLEDEFKYINLVRIDTSDSSVNLSDAIDNSVASLNDGFSIIVLDDFNAATCGVSNSDFHKLLKGDDIDLGCNNAFISKNSMVIIFSKERIDDFYEWSFDLSHVYKLAQINSDLVLKMVNKKLGWYEISGDFKINVSASFYDYCCSINPTDVSELLSDISGKILPCLSFSEIIETINLSSDLSRIIVDVKYKPLSSNIESKNFEVDSDFYENDPDLQSYKNEFPGRDIHFVWCTDLSDNSLLPQIIEKLNVFRITKLPHNALPFCVYSTDSKVVSSIQKYLSSKGAVCVTYRIRGK